MTQHILSGADQAKSTGGMIALFPRTDFAQELLIPGGETIDELHCTVIYFGEDVRGEDPTEVIDYLHYVSGLYRPIEARIFGSATFNVTGDSPCSVYLVGNSADITPLFQTLRRFVVERYPGTADQHDPYLPHITAAYDPNAQLRYEGPIVFDRIGLRWPGADQDFNL